MRKILRAIHGVAKNRKPFTVATEQARTAQAQQTEADGA